ncbi:hypothetical protein ACIBSV_46735 [Embleya sp. NPDC050154]|uniref:phage tail tube protein n=1 Tax=Embleya sp. NPDC050154 TaxID=3363988 RepID=UPI0037AD4273
MSPVVPNADRVAVGFAVVYAKLWDPLNPAVMPADTLGLFEAWGSGWVYTGATSEGWKLGNSKSKTDITIEEQSTPVDQVVETSVMSIMGDLAEDTLETMIYSYGGGTITTVAAGASQPGKHTLHLNNELAKFAVGIELKNSFGLPRRFVIPKASAGSDSETSFRRTVKRIYPVTFSSLVDPSQILIDEIVAPATS